MQEKIIGIMSAMPEEINGVIRLIENPESITLGKRTYICGSINGIKTVAVFSRWGKVAAAATVSTLILEFKITESLFTGVAGAILPDLKIGDIVIAKRLIQHDMDARPLMQRYEVPLLSKTYFEADQKRLENVSARLEAIIENGQLTSAIKTIERDAFQITKPNLWIGDIASGDQFFASYEQKETLHNELPTVHCVEMEGAAVAQVCYEYDIPFTIIRTISDTADDTSHFDFPRFIQSVASHYAVAIIVTLFQKNETP